MNPRLLTPLLTLAFLAGCAKQTDLPDLMVSAASAGDYVRFRADLDSRFTPEQLKEFDTAIKELQLDAMNRDLPSAAEREADMLRVANGKSVQAVTVLGWQARRARFLREIAELERMFKHDLELQAKTAATGTPESVTRRIGSEREVLDQLHHNLAATEQRLTELGTAK